VNLPCGEHSGMCANVANLIKSNDALWKAHDRLIGWVIAGMASFILEIIMFGVYFIATHLPKHAA